MNDREELLRYITEICRSKPDLRLGQLLCNLTAVGRGDSFGDVWEAEDRELLEPARKLAETLCGATGQAATIDASITNSFHTPAPSMA